MRIVPTCVGLFAIALAAMAEDWPSFRGPSGSGISAETKAPVKWDNSTNVKWKIALPNPANGSPIVSNGRVFCTAPEDPDGRKRSLYCFDRKDGKKLWVKTVDFGKKMPTHKTNPYCGTTPAADGERVVVWHGSAGLYCYDFEGKELWKKSLGEYRHMWGYGTSPVLYEGKVILNTGPGRRVFMVALDLKSGKTLWQTPEPGSGDGEKNDAGKPVGSWATPVITKVDGKDQIICTMRQRVVAYDPADGKILWWCEGVDHNKGELAYSSPVIAGDICMIIGGYGGPSMGVRLGGGRGDVTASHRLWRHERNPQSIGSGVFLNGYIYNPDEPGIVACMDPKTGRRVWKERSGTRGKLWGSVVLAGGNLYVLNQAGTTIVFKPTSEKFEIVSENRLGEPCNSTPAISDGEIFIQTYRNLYCIAE